MASFLLNLLYHKICTRRKTGVEVYLKTNPVANKDAFEWYQYSRDYVPLLNPVFPAPLEDCFSVEVDDSPLKDFLGNCTDLQWLKKKFNASDVIPEHAKEHAKYHIYERFFYNPYSINWLAGNDPSV